MIYDVPLSNQLGRKQIGVYDGDKCKTMYLFRWLWTSTYGVEIPDGWALHHECEVGACCNPTHMRPMERNEHDRYHHARRHLLATGWLR